MSEAAAGSGGWRGWRAPALLVALAALTWWPALLGEATADDVRFIVRNPAIVSGELRQSVLQPLFAGEPGYWRPLSTLLVGVGYRALGMTGVHVLSLLLHLGNVVLVWRLARRWLPAASALWCAALFSVHPLQVECVAWGSAFTDLLWCACALLAVRSVVAWRDAGARGWPWPCFVWCLLAPMAKETGLVALPLACAVAWSTRVPGAPTLPGRRPFVLGVAALGVWFALRHLAGAGRAPAGMLQVLRVPDWDPAAAQILLEQAALVLMPWPMTPVRTLVLPESWANVAAMVVLVLLAALLGFCRRRLTATDRVAAVLVCLPLLPVALSRSVIGAYPIADRYAYLPVAGLALVLAARPRFWRRGPWPWLLVVLLAPCSFAATWHWRDQEHLTARLLEHAPDDPMVLVMAADLELNRAVAGDRSGLVWAHGTYERVLARLPAAAGEQPRRVSARARVGRAWCLLLRRANLAVPDDDLLAAFDAAIAAAPQEPSAYVGAGVANAELGRHEAAAAAFRTALRLDPTQGAAQAGLARLQAEAGERR